jgi:hypothetical protein
MITKEEYEALIKQLIVKKLIITRGTKFALTNSDDPKDWAGAVKIAELVVKNQSGSFLEMTIARLFQIIKEKFQLSDKELACFYSLIVESTGNVNELPHYT